MVIAQGFGPRPLRYALVGLAVIYYVLLIRHPPDKKLFHAVGWFTEATGLFPQANKAAIEYRLMGWSCAEGAWRPLDPTPYFPIQADDKESRLQRVAHFYKRERVVMRALDEYIYDGHAHGDYDGISGAIGGIELVQVDTPLPPVGGDVVRYQFDPLAPLPATGTTELFYAPKSLREKRCRLPSTSP